MSMPEAESQQILIVQSDPVVRDLMATVLQRAGYAVAACDSLEAAVSALRSQCPQAILLDLFLQDGVGMGNIARLRAAVSGAVPVVVVSQLCFAEFVRQAAAAGACDFLVKPVDPETLVQRVGRVCSRHARRSDDCGQQVSAVSPVS